jgi:DNA-binding NtrC family response regulator
MEYARFGQFDPVRRSSVRGPGMEAHVMARVQLLVSDAPQRMTLHAMLEAAGHTLVDDSPEVFITDSLDTAVKRAHTVRTLLLVAASAIPDAVRAMRDSFVYDYIFVPLQPGEAAIVVGRAAADRGVMGDTSDATRSLEDVEMEHIQRVLRECKHNQAKAARILGIGRNTLWRKLKRANVAD